MVQGTFPILNGRDEEGEVIGRQKAWGSSDRGQGGQAPEDALGCGAVNLRPADTQDTFDAIRHSGQVRHGCPVGSASIVVK